MQMIEHMSNRQLEELVNACQVELQDREYRTRINPEYTNEEIFIDAQTMGLTPDDPDVIAGGYADQYLDWLSQQDIINSRKATGA